MESFAKIKRRHVVADQLPAYVSEDHATFVKFLEAYYEFLEEDHGKDSYLADTHRYQDIDSMPEDFINNFLEEIKEIPGAIAVDKRLLAKHIRDLYASKGTKKSFELLFRILYGEDIAVYEPGKDVIRASDGKWASKGIIRIKVASDFDTNKIINQFIYQYNEFDRETFRCLVSALTINRKDDQWVYVDIKPEDKVGEINETPLYDFEKSNRFFIVDIVGIKEYINRGSLSREGDTVILGDSAYFVNGVGSGVVDSFSIVSPGSGYSVFDKLVVDDAGTDGSGLSAYVSSVSGSGGITSIKIINPGFGYKKPPTVSGSVSNTTCKIIVHGSGIGKVMTIKETEPVEDTTELNIYKRVSFAGPLGMVQGEPLVIVGECLSLEYGFNFKLEDSSGIVKHESDTGIEKRIGVFVERETDYLVVKDNYGRNVVSFESSGGLLLENGNIIVNELSNEKIPTRAVIRGMTSDVKGTILFGDGTDIQTALYPEFKTGKSFLNQDGMISEGSKKMIDSRFYQDFAYVIRSSQSFELYKNIVYKLIHPAGLAVFGEVRIDTYLNSVRDKLKQMTEQFVVMWHHLFQMKSSFADSNTKINIERRLATGCTPEWLERNKCNFAPFSAHTIGTNLTVSANRDADARDSGWTVEPFLTLKFEDLYDYSGSASFSDWFDLTGDAAFLAAVADGTYITNGEVFADAVGLYQETSPTKYHVLNNSLKLPWTYGADIKQVNI